MQDNHIRLCSLEFLHSQNVSIFLSQICFPTCKPFLLNPSHIEHIQFRQYFFQRSHFSERAAAGGQNILHIRRQFQFRCGNQNELVALEAGHCFNQGVYRSAVDEVAAKTDGQMIQTPFFTFQGEQVSQGLCWVQMSAVAGVDDRTVRRQSSCFCSTSDRMPHYENICIVADNLCGVFQGFALGNRGICRIVEANQTAAQPQHSSLEGHLGTGRRFIEQGCHDFVVASTGIHFRIVLDFLA